MRGSRPRRWGSTLLWPRTIEAIVNTFIRFNSWAARRPAEVASMAGLKKIPAAARPFLTRLLRTEEVLVKGKEKSKAKLFPRTPNAEEVIAVRRPVPETARHAQVPWTTAPGTAAQRSELLMRRPLRIFAFVLVEISLVIPVGGPLPYVAEHVVEPPCIRLLLSHGMRTTSAIVLVPGHGIQRPIP